jgi:hypothetical protein
VTTLRSHSHITLNGRRILSKVDRPHTNSSRVFYRAKLGDKTAKRQK